ncbi:MAG: long-chain fatty acid--CoA ligase [Candidatus Dormibacteraeota bacterium]|nr:long-chain fatty acid--CoA ligase [Candidatus Dormibacteraeota bacterium]
MNANLGLNLATTAERFGDHPATRLGPAVMSYAQLAEQSGRVASLLREHGVGPGDRVGLMLPNVPQFAAIYYGILQVGAAVVPMNVLLKRREVAFYLGDSEAKVVFAWHDFAEEAAAGAKEPGTTCIIVEPAGFAQLLAAHEPESSVAERAGDDTAVVLYTSGTTGTPKGAELTHDNLRRNVQVILDMWNVGPHDVVLGALPLFHAFGQSCALNTTMASGATLTLIPRFDPGHALETIQRDRVTIFEGVPTMYAAFMHHPERRRYDTSSLRMCVSGGASLPLEVLRGFEEAFGTMILEGYGLSETSPVASFNKPDRPRKAGSIGTPIDGVEMKVVDEHGGDITQGGVGEIVIRGHNVMKGYWKRPDATAQAISADGWFHTGDLARIDEDGYFFIVDRKKDLVIRGGYNVYPREIEEVLYEHPAVRECAVVGIPHPELGEEVGAAVVLKDGATATAEELRDFVKERVAAYKYPRRVWFLEQLPKGPTGKILKREIQAPVPSGAA